MKPRRPDSAKSAKTRVTVDSEISSNNLTASKFSQTYSNGVKLNSDKNNDFHKYVTQKNKDPKFKKFLENNLPQIPENEKPKTQLSKLNSKPFQRKVSKNDKQRIEKKIEQPQIKIQQQSKQVKKQNLQSSKTFIDKSKQKLKLASKAEINQLQSQKKIQQKKQNMENGAKQNGNKPKINLNGFVLNIPGKAPQVIKQEKKEKKDAQSKQTRQKNQRQKLMTQLSEYVKEVEQRNIDYLPRRYDQFIDRNIGNKQLDIQKINIEEFLDDPNEKDYDNLMRKINANQLKLQSNEKQQINKKNNSSISINLQEIIDGSSLKKQQQGEDKEEDNSVIMSSMTASDVRDRNMFLTQILKGKRLTQQQVNQIKQNNNTMVKLIKLQGINRQQQFDDQQVQMVEINMNKKRTTKIMQRNKIEATGQLFRECDYLTPQQQKRIQDLINGVKIYSPYQFTEMEAFMNRRIDQGIKLHRQLSRDLQGQSQNNNQIIINEQMLPKDPMLRKNAQLKILRQKINSVNSRLSSLNEVVVNKNKIQNIINKYKQVTRPSKMSQSLICQKRKQIQQQCEKLKEAQQILKNIQSSKEDIIDTLKQLSERFMNMQSDILKMQKMDIQQLRKMQKEQLNKKRKKIQQIQKETLEFQQDIKYMQQITKDFQRKRQLLDEIIEIRNQDPKCEGYLQGQTIEDIDQLVTKKWQAAQQAVRNIRNQQDS